MYKKVHLRLTILSTGITAAIMIIMSLIYLYISEKNLYQNQYNSFKNDINTISTNLEPQSVITMEWLSRMETQNNYLFFILDNGTPFLYNQLSNTHDISKEKLLQESMDSYREMFSFSDTETSTFSSPYLSRHVQFQFTSKSTNENYFCGVIEIEKSSSLLQVIILSPLHQLKKQIFDQRIRFIAIDGAAIFLLALFSWVFTGKLLKPIIENQKKQTQFVASASHELRTPLAVILSSAECCKNVSAEEQAGFIKNICQEGLRMSTLINDLLTLSGSDNHQFSIQIKPAELDTLLINSYEAFEPLAKEKSIVLSLELPENTIPLCPMDGNRISQVVSILLHNAISYTPKSGKIQISLSYKKNIFKFSVKDNGIGIPDQDKKKIFDRFYRAEKSRSTKDHFGLGLSIAYEIIASHHGTISVTDASPSGSVFTVTLPGKHSEKSFL